MFSKMCSSYYKCQFFLFFLLFLFYVNPVSSSCHEGTNKDGYALPMYFSNNIRIKFLFDYFQVTTLSQFVICNIICVFLGAFSIFVKIIKKKVDTGVKQCTQYETPLKTVFNRHNVLHGVLSFLNYTIDYLLMLIVMTFNPFIFLSIMIGLSLMYLFWGHLM